MNRLHFLNIFWVRSHERRKKLVPVWDFKLAWKQVLFTWSFIWALFQRTQNFGGHFVLSSVYMIFHHPKCNLFLLKWLIMKSIPTMSFKCTCGLNSRSNNSALIHFVLDKFCSHKNLILAWNFILVKMTYMKFIPFWVSFRLNSCEHKWRANKNQSEIFNQNEISYQFEFISPHMWMYS